MLSTQKLLSLILVTWLTLGCHQLITIPTPQNQNQWQHLISVNLGSQFDLKEGQVALIASEKIKIKFLKVEEDSRCPSGIQCVWQGQVKIAVNVVKNERDLGEFNLISRVGEEDLAVKTFDGYSIRLIEVAPEPKKNQRLKTSDYIVTLITSSASVPLATPVGRTTYYG
jgi:predicted RecB family nuclease